MAKYELHPDMQVMIEARSPLPAGATIAQQRDNWNAYAGRLNRPHPASLDVVDMPVPCGDRDVMVRVYRHRNAAASAPCVLYLHGGGFMLGDLDSSDSVAWGFAVDAAATVVSVDYRLAPENPWPAGFDDCYDVLVWLAANGEQIGIDPARIVIAGDSAGGRFCACISQKSRDLGGPSIRAQAIIYGNGGPIENASSMVEFAEGFGLSAVRTREFAQKLFPNGPSLDDPHAYPIHADDVSGLPPTLVHVAEFDPIRDAGRAYAAKLVLAGNDVVYREARGMIHGFMRARFTGKQAAAEFAFICRFLTDHLS